MLEGLNDPENLGLIARSARAFGVDALLLDPTCIDPYYRRTVRVSMGEVLLLDVARFDAWPAGIDVAPRRRVRDLGDDAGCRRRRASGTPTCRDDSPSCSAPKGRA